MPQGVISISLSRQSACIAFSSEHEFESSVKIEGIARGGDDDAALRAGAVGDDGIAVFEEADDYTDMLRLGAGVGVLEDDVAEADIARFNVHGIGPLVPGALADVFARPLCALAELHATPAM